MRWFPALIVTAAACATIAIVTWLTFAVLGASLGDAGMAFVFVAGATAVILGATAAVIVSRR